MSLCYLLDTSIVSAPLSKSPPSCLLRKLDAHAAECAIAAPVWHELNYGYLRLEPSKRRDALEAYVDDVVHKVFPILDYDELAAAWHSVERARLEKRGKTPPFVDGQIAAIASVHELILVTANKKDFKHFQGLHLENWALS